jgi:hypothetical protein
VLHCIIDRLIEITVYYGMELNVEKTKVMRIPKLPSAIQFMIDQNPPKNAKYLKNLGSIITNDARCTRKIKSSITVAKVHSKQKRLFSPALTALTRRGRH